MLVNATVKYSAGGYPLPTYNGTTGVSLNVNENQDEDEIRELLAIRARNKVAIDLCFTTANVRITEIIIEK